MRSSVYGIIQDEKKAEGRERAGGAQVHTYRHLLLLLYDISKLKQQQPLR